MSEKSSSFTNPSLDELTHFGKKGMRWGVRKDYPSGKTIREARRSTNAQRGDIMAKRGKLALHAVLGKPTGRDKTNLSKAKLKYLKNPDRLVAAKLTKGESVTAVVLALSGVGTVPIATFVASNTVGSRIVSKRQQSGYYDRKK